MKLAVALLLWLSTLSAFTSTYTYPKERKPEISLVEAHAIAEAMLKSRADGARYHSYGANLWGDKDPKDGGWDVWFTDKDGNVCVARIPLQEKTCSLLYLQGDRGKITFTRDGHKVAASAKESEK